MEKMFYKWCFLLTFLAFSHVLIFADQNQNPAASRNVNGIVHYYATLHEAFEAAAIFSLLRSELSSIDNPDEIILLADITLYEPIILDRDVHIRLVTGSASRTIMRSSENIEYPLFWIPGENASLTLGKPGMEHELIIDGGYRSNPPIEAHSPLIAINGPDSRLVMYDNVILQNNYNVGTGLAPGSHYNYGAGILIRTERDNIDRSAGFIMKGGTIRGNVNYSQSAYPNGGAVYVNASFFTMEGGSIMDNIAKNIGGGVFIINRGTFIKTGGIIYGKNAPPGLRNIAMDGTSTGFFAHAISIETQDSAIFRFRDDTVGENEHLTFTSTTIGVGIFGKGEKWQDQYTALRRNLVISILIAAVLAISVFFVFRKKVLQKKQVSLNNAVLMEADLTPREKEVFDLFLSGRTAKQTAQALQLSISSINFHSQNMYRKLGIQSRAELLVKYKL